MRYKVKWEIDIWAETPAEAAQQALAIHRNQDSIATIFTITDQSKQSYTIDVTGVEGGHQS